MFHCFLVSFFWLPFRFFEDTPFRMTLVFALMSLSGSMSLNCIKSCKVPVTQTFDLCLLTDILGIPDWIQCLRYSSSEVKRKPNKEDKSDKLSSNLCSRSGINIIIIIIIIRIIISKTDIARIHDSCAVRMPTSLNGHQQSKAANKSKFVIMVKYTRIFVMLQ